MSKQFEKENEGVTISTTLDQGEPIEDSVNTMLSKALFGALFAVLIIMLFLRNFQIDSHCDYFNSDVVTHRDYLLEYDGYYVKYDDTRCNDRCNRSRNR